MESEAPAPAAETMAPEAMAAPGRASDEQFLQRLGQRVREAREQRGMARKALSRVADISERYLAQLEAGEGNASIVLLRHVAGALGTPLVDLLDGGEHAVEQRLISRFLGSLPANRLEQALRRLIEEFGHEESVRRKRIALIGLRGAGKSTLGGALARELRRPFLELDREIEGEAGMALPEIFSLYGQPGFRRFELRCLERLVGSQQDMVVSVGGSIVSEPEAFQMLLAHCYTIWIKASPEEHMARVIAQGDFRPMRGHVQAMDDLRNILVAREPLYAKADAIVDTTGRDVEQSMTALRAIARAGSTG
jgi:XRE family transcriptional regulator, aerobic/anaerobic benzoate catabolism transcriptional regulator